MIPTDGNGQAFVNQPFYQCCNIAKLVENNRFHACGGYEILLKTPTDTYRRNA